MPLQRTALLCCLLLVGGTRAEQPFHYPAAKDGSAELLYAGKIPVLIVSGSPEQMGTEVGRLALKPARRVLTYPRELLTRVNAEVMWGPLCSAGRTMYKQFPEATRQELEAIVRGSGAEHDLVVAGNTFFDLKQVFACSAVGVNKEKSVTSGPLLGRNLDYPSLGYIHHYSLVTVYRPKGKLAFAAVGFPGLVGVLSGMNEAGLALGVLEVGGVKAGETTFDAKGVPYAVCLRRLLEEARTIDEAVALLEKCRRTTTINVAIADRSDVGVLEVTPGRVVKRAASAGYCCATNHFCSEALKVDPPSNPVRTLDRFARLEQVGKAAGKLTPEDLRKHLDAVNLGNQTLQTMVFDPHALRLHLSVGRTPASKGPLERVDLAGWLKPVADRR